MEILNTIGNLSIAVWQHLVKNKLSILYLIIYIILFYFIYGIILINQNRQYITDNWPEYKSKPYMIPFSRFFSNTDPSENLNDYLWVNFRNAFDILIQPFVYMAEIVTRTVGDMSFTLNKFRNMASFIREMFQKMVAEVFEKLTTSMATLQFYTEKFRNLLKKQFATFQLIYYYLETMRATFDSLFNGPLPVMLLFLMIFGILAIFLVVMCGFCAASIPFFSWFVACPICLICFEPGSLIRTDTDKYMAISDIQVGDIIFPNQRVLGKLVFDVDYNYNVYEIEPGVLVSDSHLYYLGTGGMNYNFSPNPIRVADFMERLPRLTTRKLICLATSEHLIYSKSHIFADYTEASNRQLDNEWNIRVLASLNKMLDYTVYPVEDFIGYPTGFLRQVGDTEYLIEENGVILYDYCSIICSGNNIVWENNQWIRVSSSSKATIYNGPHNNRLYHTKTTTGVIKLNSFFFRDILETSDIAVYNWWNKTSPQWVQTISV